MWGEPISLFDGHRIIIFSQKGLGMREIGRQIQRSHSDVTTLNRYRATQNVGDLPQTGCPLKTTPAEDLFLQITARRNRENNATELQMPYCLQLEELLQLRPLEIVPIWIIYTPEDPGEYHQWPLCTVVSGTDEQESILHGLWNNGVKSFSVMSAEFA